MHYSKSIGLKGKALTDDKKYFLGLKDINPPTPGKNITTETGVVLTTEDGKPITTESGT